MEFVLVLNYVTTGNNQAARIVRQLSDILALKTKTISQLAHQYAEIKSEHQMKHVIMEAKKVVHHASWKQATLVSAMWDNNQSARSKNDLD